MNPSFIKPRYDSGGFAALPARVQEIFKNNQAKNVVFFFIDGFGWRFYQDFKEHPFFIALAQYGNVEKITSQFPSTTAAHVTTWNTGLPVGESGVFEWQYYEPKLDAIFAPLLYSYAGTSERETVQANGISPSDFYPNTNLFHVLEKLGVEAHVFQHIEFSHSSYSKVVTDGANTHGYKTITEALYNLRQLLVKGANRRYITVYYGMVDSIMHKYGPSSPQANAEIENTLDTLLNRFLIPLSQEIPGETTLLLTADHGHMEVDPATTIYLNTDPTFAGIEKFIKRNQAGDLIVPAGSPRDMFLYIKDDMLDEGQDFLASRFEGKADVVKTQDLIDKGYFGPTISDTFLSRVGNLIILPYELESVWWYEEGKFSQKHYGHHGGLTPQEMEIPLFVCEF